MDSKELVVNFLEELEPEEEFRGIELYHLVFAALGRVHYPDTLLRYMRQWRAGNETYTIKNVDKPKSLYKKVYQ